MLQESLTAIAAMGGAGIVQAASTDAWEGVRDRVARWFGRGDTAARLDRTAAELAEDGSERARLRQETIWQTLIEQHLEALTGPDRDQAAAGLRALFPRTAAPGGIAAGRDVRAVGGQVAANVVHGGIHISHPSPPAPSQG
ncbi:hypothetical protein ACFXDJ_01140 [Streptomyces sp. NPDC059443]|uniref:hypothetical protein n=1 Tax=unclassified Streptomyces TaxID=2593676 RepID=UPI0036A5CDEE